MVNLIHTTYPMSKIDGVSEMICLAYHDKFESKTPIEQEIIRV